MNEGHRNSAPLNYQHYR